MIRFDPAREVVRAGVKWKTVEPHVGRYEFWNDWEGAGWEQSTLDTVDAFVTEDSTFVDIGAWIGPISMWAARTRARVVSVEPDLKAFQYLLRNLRLNKMDQEVCTINAAISDHTGTCYVMPHEDGWASSMTRLSADDADGSAPVRCFTLPDLFEQYDVQNVSLVKMDIEGGESIVLEHVAPFLAELKVPLLVAMHEPWWSRTVDPAWFDGYEVTMGSFRGWDQVLALPRVREKCISPIRVCVSAMSNSGIS